MSPIEEIARSLGSLDVPLDPNKVASFSASTSLVSNHLVVLEAPPLDVVPDVDGDESEFSGAVFIGALKQVSRRKTLVERADEGMRSIRETGGHDWENVKRELGI